MKKIFVNDTSISFPSFVNDVRGLVTETTPISKNKPIPPNIPGAHLFCNQFDHVILTLILTFLSFSQTSVPISFAVTIEGT